MSAEVSSLNAKIKKWNRGLRVALFANSLPRLATYLPLAKTIRAAGHSVILLRAPQIRVAAEDIQGYEDVEIEGLSLESIPAIKGIEVFFSSEAVRKTPKGSRNVRIVHSLPDKRLATNYSTQLKHKPHLATTADYLAVAIRQPDRHWMPENYFARAAGRRPRIEAGRRKHLDIVPAGYPKIEYLLEKIPDDADLNGLVYCPTSPEVHHSRVRTLGVAILQLLLERFSNYQIVFRPYPDGKPGDFDAIRETFRHHPRFRYDDTLTGIISFRHAAMVVTDNSSAAVSYSLATGRPSVFFSDEISRPDVEMDPLGYRVSNLIQLTASLEEGLSRREFWLQKIREERSIHLYNAGTASQYLAAKLPIFARGGSDPEWLSIPRKRLFEGEFSPAKLENLHAFRKAVGPNGNGTFRKPPLKRPLFQWGWAF